MTQNTPLQVNNFNDPIDYLAALVEHTKNTNKEYSLQWLANKAGIPSKSHINKIISRKIKLTPPIAIKYLSAMDVVHEEKMKFLAWILGATAPINLLFDSGSEEIVLCKDFICLLVVRDNFKADEKWIFEKLNGAVSKESIQISLSELISTGELTLENDKWVINRSGQASTPKHLNLNLALAEMKGTTAKAINANILLSKDLINKLGDEIHASVLEKVMEYNKKDIDLEASEIVNVSFFVKVIGKE